MLIFSKEKLKKQHCINQLALSYRMYIKLKTEQILPIIQYYVQAIRLRIGVK